MSMAQAVFFCTFSLKGLCFLCACILSHVQLFAALWIIAHQSPQPMEFSRQEYWSGLPSCSRGSSWPRDWTHVSCIFCTGRWILYHWATCEALWPLWVLIILMRSSPTLSPSAWVRSRVKGRWSDSPVSASLSCTDSLQWPDSVWSPLYWPTKWNHSTQVPRFPGAQGAEVKNWLHQTPFSRCPSHSKFFF